MSWARIHAALCKSKCGMALVGGPEGDGRDNNAPRHHVDGLVKSITSSGLMPSHTLEYAYIVEGCRLTVSETSAWNYPQRKATSM